jgi:hypothetical protein
MPSISSSDSRCRCGAAASVVIDHWRFRRRLSARRRRRRRTRSPYNAWSGAGWSWAKESRVIVESDGLAQGGIDPAEHGEHDRYGLSGGFSGQSRGEPRAGFAFVEDEHGPCALADDEVAFPMANVGAGFDVFRPIVDGGAIFDRIAPWECQESCVWGHSITAGGGLSRSRRTHWTDYSWGAIQRRCFRKTGFSMS